MTFTLKRVLLHLRVCSIPVSYAVFVRASAGRYMLMANRICSRNFGTRQPEYATSDPQE
jgi:hypothetical protein